MHPKISNFHGEHENDKRANARVPPTPAKTSLWSCLRAWELHFGAGFLSVQKETLGMGACLVGAASVLQCHCFAVSEPPASPSPVTPCTTPALSYHERWHSLLAWTRFTIHRLLASPPYPTADAKLPSNTLRFLCPTQQAQLLQGVFEVRPHEQFARVLELIQPKQMCCFPALVPIENTSPYCSFTLARAPICQPPFQTLRCRRCSCNVSNKTMMILQVSPPTGHVVDTPYCQHIFASKILTCLHNNSPDTKLRPLAMLIGCLWCTCGTHSCGIGQPWPEWTSPMSTPQRQYYASAWRYPPSSSDSLHAPPVPLSSSQADMRPATRHPSPRRTSPAHL